MAKVALWFYGRSTMSMTEEQRHMSFSSGMNAIDGPLGWKRLAAPPLPSRRKGDLDTSFEVRYPLVKVNAMCSYQIRDERYIDDVAADDDKFMVEFSVPHSVISYDSVLIDEFCRIATAFKAYRAVVFLDSFASMFRAKHAPDIAALRAGSGDVDINGRNNIFTLHPAQYWDAELCQKALGYSPDEVIRRLDGQVPLVRPLMDGVYTVFNDDPDLSFEDFCAFNDRFKPILGLA